jgi:hypothetical protein
LRRGDGDRGSGHNGRKRSSPGSLTVDGWRKQELQIDRWSEFEFGKCSTHEWRSKRCATHCESWAVRLMWDKVVLSLSKRKVEGDWEIDVSLWAIRSCFKWFISWKWNGGKTWSSEVHFCETDWETVQAVRSKPPSLWTILNWRLFPSIFERTTFGWFIQNKQVSFSPQNRWRKNDQRIEPFHQK